MRQVSYMLPEEHVDEINRLSEARNITRDEMVRRAVAEYLAKESARTEAGYVPSEIKTSSLRHSRE